MIVVLVATSAYGPPSHAESDEDAAREELTVAYELKQHGHCDAALPHLRESLRLDHQIKTLMHLADCEEQLGLLISARQHWTEAFERADSPRYARFRADAAIRREALERRLPRLTISVPEGVAARVHQDDVPLDRADLGRPRPVDPGEHRVSVAVAGHETARYAVTLREGDEHELIALPGPRLSAQKAQTSSLTNARSERQTTANLRRKAPESRRTPGPDGVQSKVGWAVLGFGSGVFAASGVSWLVVWAKYRDEPATCSDCDSRLDEPRRAAVRSVIGMVAGAALVGTGLALTLTAPRGRSSPATSIALTHNPALGSGLDLRCRW